uniref:Uncharacterized protein n=1 Tax=Arundo donax TaxID=35708 RepID=A0A0A9A1N9_ARUDO
MESTLEIKLAIDLRSSNSVQNAVYTRQ